MTHGNEPINAIVEDNNYEGQLIREAHFYGLTKREYFAGLAIQGMISTSRESYKYMVQNAVIASDELITALNTPKP